MVNIYDNTFDMSNNQNKKRNCFYYYI